MQFFLDLWQNILNNDLITIPHYIKFTDIVEILIISFLAYSLMVWIKTTRAWSLLRGVIVIAIFILVAAIFSMSTILWIVQNVISVAVIAIVVILQPELRRALEQLGRKNILTSMLSFDTAKQETGRFTDRTVNEITKACLEMSRDRTGALIVVEQNDYLIDYEKTGIDIDAIVTSELLINIFEHNTPLHDGAVLIRGNRIIAATCYLPLSDNPQLGKDLGTRHRAAIGMSEETDSMTIIVSEENGCISIAYKDEIKRGFDGDGMRKQLMLIQDKRDEEKKTRRKAKSNDKAVKREASEGKR
ncbi:MAG: diadenylate cyclase CdaA [Lachnospiraceae bacterium]|jgi:diadenylate cyclase|nr:diadenylate cyclase CdaA [Lachnospiraceae bacterium]